MNAIHRMYADHWSDRPEADTRVSLAEQQDYQVPIGANNNGDVILLIAPIVLTLIGAVALVGSYVF